MSIRRTIFRIIGRRELTTVILSLILGFMLSTWLRAHQVLEGQELIGQQAIPHRRCKAAGIPPQEALDSSPTPRLPSKNLIYVGVLTAEKYLHTRAVAVSQTWANTIPGEVNFFTSGTSVIKPGLNLPLVRLQGVNDAYPPQKKSFMMLKYMHDNYIDKYEWFMRADDDVYVRGDRLEPFLRSINSSQHLFLGQAGLGKQEELGLLNLESGDNFCMGGPGMIFSRETLRKVAPHISYCLKNMWSTHEDVEIGRCIKKFAEVDCTWAYEMQTLFYNNYSKSDTAFTGSLESSDVHRAITLHPIKRTPYVYRLHNHLQSVAIADLKMNTIGHYRQLLQMKQLLNEELYDRNGQEEDPQLQTLGIQPGLLQYAPDTHEDVVAWDFFRKYWYTLSTDVPRRNIPKYWMISLDHITKEVMSIINSNSKKVSRTIEFKEILYGYTRVTSPFSVDYVLDMLLMYQKHMTKTKQLPVRRHAYLQQSFGKLELAIIDEESPRADGRSSIQGRVQGGISKSLFGMPRRGNTVEGSSPTNSKLIHFVVPLAGRLDIFKRFMLNFERICLAPRENAHLVIVLFGQPENDSSEEIVKTAESYSAKYPRSAIKIVHAEGKFSRGLGLSLAASQLPKNALMFFVDIDMHISPEFLTRCRLNTRQGQQVYYPIVFGQYSTEVTYGPGVRPETKLAISKDTGFFRNYGFGMACMYNSDLGVAGGFDPTIVGWGMEDVDLYQKFIASNLTIFRAPDPTLIHIYHPLVCDTGFVQANQYEMCLGSKAKQYGSSRHLVDLLQKDSKDIEIMDGGEKGR